MVWFTIESLPSINTECELPMSPHLIPLYVFSLDLNSHDYHKAAIDNLEAMLDPNLRVDAVLIGPHDLSCNLGNH